MAKVSTNKRRRRSPSAPGEISSAFPGVVIVDTREQLGYSFANITADADAGGGKLFVPTLTLGLPSGDYSLQGYEGEVGVERKSKGDLYSTIGQGRDRFVRELERLDCYTFAAVVVEAEWSEVLSDPPSHSQLAPKTVMRSILAWMQRYPRVHWQFVPGRDVGELFTFRMLERFLKEREAELKELAKGESK